MAVSVNRRRFLGLLGGVSISPLVAKLTPVDVTGIIEPEPVAPLVQKAIELSWQKTEEAVMYKVYRNGLKVGEVLSTAGRFLDGTPYNYGERITYQIAAVSEGSWSDRQTEKVRRFSQMYGSRSDEDAS